MKKIKTSKFIYHQMSHTFSCWKKENNYREKDWHEPERKLHQKEI